MKRAFCLLVLAAFSAGGGGLPALAALRFESTEIMLKPALGEKAVVAEFKFKNTGDVPLAITRVQSGCGCTVPEKPTDPVAPGASGVIPVTYKAGERQGRQTQSVMVETADGVVTELRLTVDVPVRVSFSPRLLIFRGADVEAKVATLTYAAEAGSRFLGAIVSSQAFEIAGEPRMDSGGVLKVSLRYVGAAGADERASVRVRTRDANGAEHTDIFYVRHTPAS